MQILEAPIPDLRHRMVLVRNYYSLISAGTEGSTVKAARKDYLSKAKERPQQIKQVIDTLKTQGPVQTHRAVKFILSEDRSEDRFCQWQRQLLT